MCALRTKNRVSVKEERGRGKCDAQNDFYPACFPQLLINIVIYKNVQTITILKSKSLEKLEKFKFDKYQMYKYICKVNLSL